MARYVHNPAKTKYSYHYSAPLPFQIEETMSQYPSNLFSKRFKNQKSNLNDVNPENSHPG